MAAVTITNLETLQTAVNGDSTLTKAQKSASLTLLYAMAVRLFGPSNFTSTVITNGNDSIS
jgi:hypothetical protein